MLLVALMVMLTTSHESMLLFGDKSFRIQCTAVVATAIIMVPCA